MEVKRLELRIDRLVLRGARPEDAKTILATFSEELKSQLQDPQLARSLAARGNRALLDVAQLNLPRSATSGRLAALLAALIAQKLRE